MSTNCNQFSSLLKTGMFVGLMTFLLFFSVKIAGAVYPDYYDDYYDAPVEAIYDAHSDYEDYEVAEHYVPKALPKSRNNIAAAYRPNQSLPMTAPMTAPMPAPVPAANGTNRLMPRIKTVSGHNQYAMLDAEYQPGQLVMPPALLMDEYEMQTVASLPRTKVLQNSRTYPMLTYNAVEEDIVYGDEMIFDHSEIYDVPEHARSVYTKCAPALGSYYTGSPMVRPFGMGQLDNLTIFAGTTGFKNELDGGLGSSFGYYEGFNWGGPATPQNTFAAQLGFRATQSDTVGSPDYDRLRCQYFLTAGVFKRDLSSPLQGGAVLDWFQDDRYDNLKIRQVRTEVSLRTFSNTEYGLLGVFGINKAYSDTIDDRDNYYHEDYYYGPYNHHIRASDYYQVFLRKHIAGGSLAETRIGATSRGDIVLNGLGEFAINDRLTLNGGVSLTIPKEGNGANGYRRENWELSVGFIYYFRGGACSKPTNACRPMFDVANNGSFVHKIR